jgi:hypothetical protein
VIELPEHKEIVEQCQRHFLGEYQAGKQPAVGFGAHQHDAIWVDWSSRLTIDQIYRSVHSGELPGKSRLTQLVRDEVYLLHRQKYGFVGIAGLVAWIRIAWVVARIVSWLMTELSKGHTSLGMAMRSRNRG